MAYSLLSKLGELTFTVEEQDAVVVTPTLWLFRQMILHAHLWVRLSPPPTVDGSRLIRQFRSIRRDDKVQGISEISTNFFFIAFASPANRTNVLERGPWDFQKYWFALEQADPNRTIHDYSFQHMCISVRIHNIPLSLMMAALARALGASVGKVIMIDTRLENGNMGEFTRVRVSFDTSKPLRRCVVLSRPDAKASLCPLQYECLPLFCHGCGLIGHSVLACPTTPKVEGQKFQYGAWLRAPLPKRSASRPRGRLSVVGDDTDAPEMVDSASEGPSVHPDTTRAVAPASDPVVPVVAAPVTRTPPAPVATPDAANLHGPSAPFETADLVGEALDDASLDLDASEAPADRSTPDDAPYDPMVHTETSDMLEEALEISRDFVLLADLTGVIQANGEDLVNEAILEAMKSIIREVAASILGVSTSLDAAVVSSRPSPTPVTSPAKLGLSKSAPAGSRFAATTMVPEHHEFDEWCAAQSRTPVAAQNQPAVARTSSIPPLRPHKRQASSSDPSRAKRFRPSTSSTTRIPSVPKAGMRSVNNSSAETARQSRLKVDLLLCFSLHIDVVISYDSSTIFRFTGMHGRSESALKKHNWALIDRLQDASSLPWLLGGVFNEILTLSEKQGGSRKPHHQLTDFRECLIRNDLADCKPSRGWFTWMQSGPRIAPIWERLDRFVAGKNWLSTVCDGLRHWQSSKRTADWGCIPKLRSEINCLSSRRLNPEDLEALLAAKGELRHLLNTQEVYWAQHSWVLWLSAGDRNTSFFHAKASTRRRKNAIMGLHDAHDHWQTSTDVVLHIASDYLVDLFSTGPSIEIPTFLEYISPSITDDMNSTLTADFTTDDVISAFWDINPPLDILGDDFVSLCLDLLRGHAGMASVNETVIVLIPKVDEPTSMRQLRPISLCIVIYKTVSKVLVNRMKSILPSCISNTQAAFVQGRAITDNILVAHELVHTHHTSVSRSSQEAVFKLDMEKAFDQVEWPFLKVVMLRLGFAQSWVELIMHRVSSMSSRVRVRGTLSEAFLPQRGLRQGDPLSPFLFLFGTEGLSAALTVAQREGRLPGVRASKHGPRSIICFLLMTV
ncbi:hypothetical protein GQ457_18G000180 [Hibiscus cannabinus]